MLLPCLLLSWLCMSCFELSVHHPGNTIYSGLKNNQNNITVSQEDSWPFYVCQINKSVYIISLLDFSVFQPESRHLRSGYKALSAYSLVSNTVFLFKLSKEKQVRIYHQLKAQLEVKQIKFNEDCFNSHHYCLLTVVKKF